MVDSIFPIPDGEPGDGHDLLLLENLLHSKFHAEAGGQVIVSVLC